MKPTSLNFPDRHSLLRRVGPNPFRERAAARAPYLVRVKPVDLRPVQPALAADAEHEQSCEATAGRVESIALRMMRGLAVIFVVAWVFGMQHIAHARQQVLVLQKARADEEQVRVLTQTIHVLKSDLAIQAARAPAAETMPVALRPLVPHRHNNLQTIRASVHRAGTKSKRV